MDWRCPEASPTCAEAALCDRCYGRELTAKRPQARVLGACWAERICRGELRSRETWPAGSPKTLAIARRLVGSMGADPRLLDELAKACDAGAAAWWAGRPARYREP